MRPALYILAALALLGGGFALGRRTAPPPPEPSVVRDTLRLRDTVRVPVPVPVEHRVTDTLELEVVTTVHDTVVAMLPREEVRYEDSTYTAIVSGIRPRLDYLAIYPERQVVTVTEVVTVPTSRRWSLGVQAGYGLALAGGQVRPAPYVGVGVSFNLASW